MLFSGCIHFASRARDIFLVHKRKHTIIVRSSLRLTQTPVAQRRNNPCQVGNTRTRFLRFLTRFPSAQQWNHRVCPDILYPKPSGLNRIPRFLPVMTTRLLLSLRKASASQEHGWSFGEPTTYTSMRFSERRYDVAAGDATQLDTFVSTHEGPQS